MERVHLTIHGRVQGVFFRANAQKEAMRLKVGGWVHNTPDGSVEAIAEGPKASLESFIGWCHRGPASAHVDKVDVVWEKAQGLGVEFHIRY